MYMLLSCWPRAYSHMLFCSGDRECYTTVYRLFLVSLIEQALSRDMKITILYDSS